jgi:hypothetical protein
MIIVRLLSPEPFWLAKHHQLYSGVGADIVMESITLAILEVGAPPCSLRSPRGHSPLRRAPCALASRPQDA